MKEQLYYIHNLICICKASSLIDIPLLKKDHLDNSWKSAPMINEIPKQSSNFATYALIYATIVMITWFNLQSIFNTVGKQSWYFYVMWISIIINLLFREERGALDIWMNLKWLYVYLVFSLPEELFLKKNNRWSSIYISAGCSPIFVHHGNGRYDKSVSTKDKDSFNVHQSLWTWRNSLYRPTRWVALALT